jgi:hypothetical protein
MVVPPINLASLKRLRRKTRTKRKKARAKYGDRFG